MDKGVIQQVGPPDEIYDRPENIFVADFVGSPSMNILDCEVERSNGSLTAVDRGNEIAFDLSNYSSRRPIEAGRKVKVGFRSEHFHAADEPAIAGKSLRLERPVEYFEKSGPDTIAFLTLPRQTIAARVDSRIADRRRAGPALPVTLSLEKINVFDAQSGRRV